MTTFPDINPATEELITNIPVSSVADITAAVANADDYYGPEGLAAVASFLDAGRVRIGAPGQWAMIGYRLGNTLPETGAVAQGLCRHDDDGNLLGLKEILKIERSGNHAGWIDDDGVRQRQAFDSLVSMNLWGFTGSFMGKVEGAWNDR